MPEMVAPRVSRFRPLLKENEDSGNEIGFRVVRPLGAFVLLFLEAQIKSTCISQKKVLYIFHKTMYNKTIIRYCDIRNNQGLRKCNRPWLFQMSQRPHPIIVYNHTSDSQNRTTAKRESDLLITSMITDRIGRSNVLFPSNHNNYNFPQK